MKFYLKLKRISFCCFSGRVGDVLKLKKKTHNVYIKQANLQTENKNLAVILKQLYSWTIYHPFLQ
jgi:hypothetical protein